MLHKNAAANYRLTKGTGSISAQRPMPHHSSTPKNHQSDICISCIYAKICLNMREMRQKSMAALPQKLSAKN
jgi:hypothetical protein